MDNFLEPQMEKREKTSDLSYIIVVFYKCLQYAVSSSLLVNIVHINHSDQRTDMYKHSLVHHCSQIYFISLCIFVYFYRDKYIIVIDCYTTYA